MRGPRLIHLWGPLSHCYEEKWKRAIQFELSRKWRCGRSKITSIKNYKSSLECAPRSLRLLLPSTKKRSMTRNCWNRTWLAGTGLSIFPGKPTGNLMVNYLTQHMAYGLHKLHIWFFLSVLKKNKHLAHMCGGIKMLKHNVWTTLRLAYHGCKNFTHTNKTR